MTQHLGRVLTRSALVLALLAPALHAAQPDPSLKPVKRHDNASDAFAEAQVQIARLRQTADRLRLLAGQPHPSPSSGDTLAEYARYEAWLRRAETRVSTLADRWEEQLRPLGPSPRRPEAHVRLLDLNAFFENQLATLQTRLHQESVSEPFRQEYVRDANGAARLVIRQMGPAR